MAHTLQLHTHEGGLSLHARLQQSQQRFSKASGSVHADKRECKEAQAEQSWNKIPDASVAPLQ